MSDKFTEADKKLAMERMKYKVANNLKKEDRLTQKDLEDAKKVVKTRMKYEIAEENKSEDRLTQRDIEAAEESLPKFSNGGGVAIQGTKFTGVK